MIKHLLVYGTIIIAAFASCTTVSVSDWDDQQVRNWLNSSSWSNEIPFKPDPGMNKRSFAEQNIRNPKAWQAAYAFLKKNDLATLPSARYNLLDDGTYATISEYYTKAPDTLLYESHKKFIDIQYVISGKEKMGITHVGKSPNIVKEYNPEKDIVFYSMEDSAVRLADQKHFFVFFPADAHKPGIKADEPSQVRKVVVKIPYLE